MEKCYTCKPAKQIVHSNADYGTAIVYSDMQKKWIYASNNFIRDEENLH